MSNKAHNRPSTQPKKKRVAKQDPAVAELQMTVLNLRQLYEQSTQEKTYLQQQLQQSQSLSAMLVLQNRKSKVVIKQATMDRVIAGEVAGLSIEPGENQKGLVLEVVYAGEEEEVSVPPVPEDE